MKVRERLVVNKLVELEKSFNKTQTEDANSSNLFSENDDANKLCQENRFAFLLACLAAQGMKAKKIWEFPYQLQMRLGNIDPFYISENPDHVLEAIKAKPALHRFPSTMAKYVVDLATLYERGYLVRIFQENQDARYISDSLLFVSGFGLKKSTMATQLIHSFLRIKLVGLERINVAPDVHVIRVLNRLGLANTKNQLEIQRVAKKLNPKHPGLLDYPLWTIGRTWCKARNPNCTECPMKELCKKKI